MLFWGYPMTKARIGFAIIQVSLIGAICSVGAGIVAPDLSARGTSLEEAKFVADLRTVRCQFELYKNTLILKRRLLPGVTTIAGLICGPFPQIRLTAATLCDLRRGKAPPDAIRPDGFLIPLQAISSPTTHLLMPRCSKSINHNCTGRKS
jgi:hypothetical protein